jgi:hypothetical protein
MTRQEGSGKEGISAQMSPREFSRRNIAAFREFDQRNKKLAKQQLREERKGNRKSASTFWPHF